MGILLPAAIFTQIVFLLLSKRIAVLTGVLLSIMIMVNQLIFGVGLAGFKLYVPAGITLAGILVLLATASGFLVGWGKDRSRIVLFFTFLFLVLMIVLNQALPGEDVFFRIVKFAVPGPIVFALSALWFLATLYLLIREVMTDRGYRGQLRADLRDAVSSNIKIYSMIVGLMVLMFVIVFSLVFLVQRAPVVFRSVSLVFIIGLLYFLLARKYSNMKKLEVSDTRLKSTEVPLFYRFLYASIFKPVIICLLIILYVYVLYTFNFSPIIAIIGFILLTIILTFFSRLIKARLGSRR